MAEDSSLDSWSDIIKRQGEQARQREEEQTQIMLVELPAKLEAIPFMEAGELLDHWYTWQVSSHIGYGTPRKQLAIFRLLAMRVRREIIGRMT